MKLFLFLYVSYLSIFGTGRVPYKPFSDITLVFKIFSRDGSSSRISRSSNRLNSQIREVKTMNLIMRGTLAKRGFIWTVQVLAWPAACQSLCDEGCRFQTHLKLRNECEILKNEIYSVKSELKVLTLYFLSNQWFRFFRTERLRKFVFEFWTLFYNFFLTFFQKFLHVLFYELHVIFSLSMIIFGSRQRSYWVWFSLFRRA